MRPIAAILAVLLALAAAAAQPPASQPVALPPKVEQCLKFVPDDARLVLVVPNLEDLVRGAAAFGKTAGLAELAEITAHSVLDEALGKSAGALDSGGAFVLALCAQCDEPLLVAGLGSDQAWRNTTQPSVLRENVLLFELCAERYVAASTEGIAILARDQNELRRALDARGSFAGRLAKEARDLLTRRQIVCYVDAVAWRDTVDAGLATLEQTMAMGMAAAGGNDSEAAVQVWSWVFEQTKKLVAQTQAVVASVQIDGQGLLVGVQATFSADGSVVRYLKQVQRAKRDLLRGLPASDAAVICAYEWEEGKDTEGANAAFIRSLFRSESLKEKVGADRLEALLQQSIELNRKVQGSNLALSYNVADKGLLYCGLYFSQDGPGVQREMRAICETAPELVNAWGTFPSTKLTRQPEQVAGVEADTYQFSFDTENLPAHPMVQPMMQAMYGKDPTLFMAPHADGVAFTFGPRETARDKLGELLRTKKSPLSEDARIAAALAHLAPDPQGFVLVDVLRGAKSLCAMIEQLGVPFPGLDITPTAMPLAGAALYLDSEAVRGELYIPADPIRAIVKPLEQLQDPADKAY